MPNIRLLQTVEDTVRTFITDEAANTPQPLNQVASRRGGVNSRADDGEMATLVCLLPQGGEFAVGERQAERLVSLGYAETI